MQAIDYYNKHVDTGINDRHEHVFGTLDKLMHPGLEVLDVGCGSGATSLHMATKGARVTAVDYAEKRIEYAKRVHEHPAIEYIVADATTMDLGKQFDLIVLVDVYEHIPKGTKAALFLFNIAEHSKENAGLFLHIPDHRYQRFMRDKAPQQPVDEERGLPEIISQLAMIDYYPMHLAYSGQEKAMYLELVCVRKGFFF